MASYLLDWLALLLRWLHLIAGVAWIGASFYFVWLDNHLQPPFRAEDAAPEVAGEVWAVHGGGFYRARKYRLAPPVLPPTLHWFYWEAYTTWLSGFALLCLLYFVRADAYLIDPAVAAITRPQAIAIALALLVCSWLGYDLLCRSRLAQRTGVLASSIGLALALEAWALCRLFSGRGAFMMFGAVVGTLMVANVLFVIIPGQRELVRATQQGRDPDPAAGSRGKQRSVHNTYFTLPVLFVMISNHYAMTYGGRYNWLVLVGMSFGGACIRAWFVARHSAAQRGGRVPALPALLGTLALAAVVIGRAPRRGPGAAAEGRVAPALERAQVQLIIAQRCVPCHALHPTQPGFEAAPNGLTFDALDGVRARLPEVQQQLATRAMPLGNLTGMTEQERAALLQWAAHEAQPGRELR